MLKPGYALAFEFSDCWVDDARLVVLNARDAADRGAKIPDPHPRHRCPARGRHLEGDGRRTREMARRARSAPRMLINAAGPWVDGVSASIKGPQTPRRVRLVKGSHIVVEKLFDHDKCYFFQNSDGRVLFAIPYESDFTLIGTTDLDYQGDPAEVGITAEEITYLLDAANDYFAEPVTRERIVWAYSGVRPLFDDGASKAQEATRDYVLRMENDKDEPALPRHLRRQADHLPPPVRTGRRPGRHGFWGARPGPGPPARRCRAANSMSTGSTARSSSSRRPIPICRPRRRGVWSGSTAPALRACSRVRHPAPISVKTSVPA